MKIGLTTHTYTPEFIGGREIHVESLAKLLSKKHDVVVFTGSSLRKSEKLEMNGYTLYKIPLFTLPLPDNESYRIVPDFIKFLLREDLDVIHAHEYGHFTTDMANIYSKVKHTPLVISVHGHFFRLSLLNTLKKIYDKTVGIFSLKNAKKIICISDAQKKEILNAYGSKRIERKIEIIPNGIFIKNFHKHKHSKHKQKNQNKNGKVILSMGRLVYRKGFHILIDAAKQIQDNVKIVIAGPDGGERKNLEKQISNNNLNNKVILINSIDGETKENLLFNSDVFVIPSLYEGLPTTLLEAMFYGKPVISTDLPGIRGVIEDSKNGFVVTPGSSVELSEKINFILKNDSLAKKMGRENMKKVKKFYWSRIIKKIESIYEEVLTC